MGIIARALRPVTGRGIFWPQNWPALDTPGRSLSGAKVTEESAYGVPAFYAAVRNIAEDIAKLPFIVYETLPDRVVDQRRYPGGKRRAPEHPLYRVLHDVANPMMTAFTWREVSVGHLLTWGNCYSEIVRDQQGNIRELWPLPPDRVTVKLDENDKKIYIVRFAKPDADGNIEATLDARDVFHVPGLGYDGLVGYSPIEMMAKALGVALAAQEHAERFWANNGRPGGTLVVPAELDLSEKAEANLMKHWNANHTGLSNAQRVGLLRDGITFQDIGIAPEQAQFIETRKFQVTEIARALRMQPHKIMDLERATFSNIEHQDLEYTRDSLGGIAGRFEAQAKKDLFETDDPHFAELLFDALLRADSLTRARVWSIYRMQGNVTANYINERENFPLREDAGGDEYMLPLNVTTEGGSGTDQPSTPTGGQGPLEDVIKTTITAVPDSRTGNGRATPQEVSV